MKAPHTRVAVVGAGVMGRYHASVYTALPSASLVAMVDPDPDARTYAAAQYGCDVFESVDAMLGAVDVEAASVAAPTSLHHRIATQMLEAGIHILVEKPVATEVGQARELAALSRLRGKVMQVGHITRFYRAVQLLKREVTRPYLIEARRLTPNTRIKDVGVILDLMIHDIDIVLGLVKAPVADVCVAGHALNGSRHEDVAAAQITFTDGCIARFLASRVAPDAERSLVVAEANQTFRLDFAREPHTEIAIYRPQPSAGNGNHVHVDRHVVFEDNPLRKELEHFLARIRNAAPPIGTLEDDLRSLTLATDLLARLAGSRAVVGDGAT
ncbi:MAG: Gfo/Idh/MocA family oxidoreductase [Trueperaceae bacterium]|nr:Gfo/Idh/MocA family oxidoreductase [Trueperaceae bacterium]